MSNQIKKIYESPKIRVFEVHARKFICTSPQNASLGTMTNYEEDWE